MSSSPGKTHGTAIFGLARERKEKAHAQKEREKKVKNWRIRKETKKHLPKGGGEMKSYLLMKEKIPASFILTKHRREKGGKNGEKRSGSAPVEKSFCSGRGGTLKKKKRDILVRIDTEFFSFRRRRKKARGGGHPCNTKKKGAAVLFEKDSSSFQR